MLGDAVGVSELANIWRSSDVNITDSPTGRDGWFHLRRGKWGSAVFAFSPYPVGSALVFIGCECSRSLTLSHPLDGVPPNI